MSIRPYQSHEAPFGEPIPATPHAVSVSLPTLADVAAVFKEHDKDAIAGLQTVYPRFGVHPFVAEANSYADIDPDREIVGMSSPAAAERLVKSMRAGEIVEHDIQVIGQMTFLSYEPRDAMIVPAVALSLRLTGEGASSRRAEDFLIQNATTGRRRHAEERDEDAIYWTVTEAIERIYGGAEKAEVFLTNSGQNAVSATINALHEVANMDAEHRDIGRDTWIRIGNLYRDTNDFMARKEPDVRTQPILDVYDIEQLKEVMQGSYYRIAGIITEAPTNPLLDVPDLEQIREVIGLRPLVVDVSTAGSMNVDALPYADVVVESLTKSASGYGDVMAGAVIVNQASQYAEAFVVEVLDRIEAPYEADIQRLAHELPSWKARAAKTGRNVVELAEFFDEHSAIDRVHWTGGGKQAELFAKLARGTLTHAGVITIEVCGDLAKVYDRLALSKGPSFGTYFTINTPYTQITAPQDIGTDLTRQKLADSTGLNPSMLRVSVGNENGNDLIAAYRDALPSSRPTRPVNSRRGRSLTGFDGMRLG